MRSDKIFYSLCIQDIQDVALDTLDRKLTEEEIKKVLEPIADRISLYDAIQDAIVSKFERNKKEEEI